MFIRLHEKCEKTNRLSTVATITTVDVHNNLIYYYILYYIQLTCCHFKLGSRRGDSILFKFNFFKFYLVKTKIKQILLTYI